MTTHDAVAPETGLLDPLRQAQIEARCATVRRAAEDGYRRVAVSAVANEPCDSARLWLAWLGSPSPLEVPK